MFDKKGNEISNPAEERKKKSVDFAILIDKYKDTDKYFMKMRSSYYSSISDPDNEFVHLYEVRDTVSSLFKGSKEAMNTLNISKSRWDVLGKLANIEPLLEGRHRGSVKQSVELRRANTYELKMARQCAVELIEKYLNYREQQNTLTKSLKATPKNGAL